MRSVVSGLTTTLGRGVFVSFSSGAAGVFWLGVPPLASSVVLWFLRFLAMGATCDVRSRVT